VPAAVIEGVLAVEIAEHREGRANPRFVIEKGVILEGEISPATAETHGSLSRLLIVEDAFRFEAIHRDHRGVPHVSCSRGL
jgi:hypothetical protein